jgi:hypothetical protein
VQALPPGVYALASILSFVLACGLVIWVIRSAGRRRNRVKPSPSPAPLPSPPKPNTSTQQEPSSTNPETGPPQPSKAVDREELLSVARTEEGEMLVLARGQPYRRLRDINDPRLGQDTIEAIHAMLVFAEGWIPFIQKWSAESAKAAQEHLAPQSPQQGTTPYPGRPTSPTSTTTIPRPGSLLEPLPLVSEINDLVQRRLKEHPDLSEHLITLTTAVDGSLRIYVDHTAFQSVDAISDPGVRNLIQNAIQEWEGR